MAVSVDHAEIKLGQLITMGMAVAAYVLADPRWLFALGMIFLITGFARPLSPFVVLYRRVVQPLRLMRSDYRLDNIEPHAFGQLVGAVTVALAVGLLYSGYELAGWVVVGVLVGLTLVSCLGWCIGCFLYYQMNRLGLRGFFRHTPADTSVIPGQRPGKK